MKTFGRPYSALTPMLVSQLWAEYQEKPYNVSARARALGVKPSTLAYHIRGGKVARVMKGTTWRAAAKLAYRAFSRGDRTEAAAWLREAAKRMEAKA